MKSLKEYYSKKNTKEKKTTKGMKIKSHRKTTKDDEIWKTNPKQNKQQLKKWILNLKD